MSLQHLEIVPSNITSSGKLSFKSGQPVIQFLIGEQDRHLLGSSVRFVGRFNVWANDTGTLLPVLADGIRMSEKLGMYSIIDQLHISSQKTGQTIESIRHFNRMMGSYLPVTSSEQDALGHGYETSLTFPNFAGQQAGVVNNAQADTTASSFAIHLPCGLFLGANPIPLSGSWGLGGLNIEIHLAPDSNVLFSGDRASTPPAVSASLQDAYYELSDVRLVAEVQTPSPDVLSQLMSQTTNTYDYNSITSFFNTVNSANGIINYNLGVSKCLGVFANVVPAGHINNLQYDGLSTLPFTNSDGTAAKVQQLVFTRAGERYPLEYNIDTLQRTDINDNTADSQIARNYLNAVMAFARIQRTQPSPLNVKYKDYTSNYSEAKNLIDGGSAWGIGVSYDSISGDGVDFSTVPLGINLTMDLTTDQPNAVYVFCHCRNTVVSSPQGIQVLS